MNAKKLKTKEREISEKLRLAVSAEFVLAHPDLTTVTGNDLRDLKDLLQGENLPEFSIDRKRAIALLARSDNSAEATEILASILSNPDETEANRSQSALHLSAMSDETAEKNLLKNLSNENPLIRAEVLKSLALIGSEAALEHLNRLSFPGDLNSQQQLTLAKLLIRLRNNPDELSLESARKALGIQWTDQAVKIIEGKPLQDLITALGERPYNISLNRNVGFAFDCADLAHYLLLNSDLAQGEFISILRQKAYIAGLVAVQAEAHPHLSPRYIVLTFPTDKGVEVMVTRANGEVVYNGEIAAVGNKLQGILRDVGIERTPTEVAVTISAKEINITNRRWQGINKKKKPGRVLVH